MSHLYGSLVFFLILGCFRVMASPHNDPHLNVMKEELNRLLQEPAINRILGWGEYEERQEGENPADYVLLRYSRCEEDTPGNCLFNHYLNQYLKAQLDTINIFTTAAYALYVMMGVFIVNYTCVLMLYLNQVGVKKDSTPVVISLYAAAQLFLITVFAVIQANRESWLEVICKQIRNQVLNDVKNDYLQLIFALLAKSFTDIGATIETSVKKAPPVSTDTPGEMQPVTLHTLGTYTDINFSNTGRQVVMLDNNMNTTGFFRILVRAPYSGGIELILDNGIMRYILYASRFDLAPLLTLLNKAGVEKVQLMSVDRDFNSR